jgi:hypothetical protein
MTLLIQLLPDTENFQVQFFLPQNVADPPLEGKNNY